MNIGVKQKRPAIAPAFFVGASGLSFGFSTTRAEREWVLPVTPISTLPPCGAAFEVRWRTHRGSQAATEGEEGYSLLPSWTASSEACPYRRSRAQVCREGRPLQTSH